MAKSVNFNIKLNVDGKEHLITASTNVRKLADELGIAESKGGGFGRAMAASMRDVSVLSANAMAGIQQLTSVMSEWTAAAQVQQEAETKLATVMRQRMAATDEDITAIKSLAVAQQELGIIGDEVQLAGAQQVATFLTERQALETLIPAMNNLIAQQKGYNATSADAVSVGNLMGKVMQGQVSALTRVGITFSDVQAEVLKTGTEMERAAMLAEVITANVGEMNAALAATDAGRAKQVSNAIGDLKERVGALFASVQPTITAVGQLGLALSALVTMTSGVKALGAAFVVLGNSALVVQTRTKLATVAMTAWHKAAVLCRAASIALTRALQGTAVSATAAKVAIKGLLLATGVGAAIAVLTSAVEYLMRRFDSAEDAADAFGRSIKGLTGFCKDAKQAYQSAAAEIETYRLKIDKARGSQQEEAALVSELNNKYGDALGRYSSLNDWYDTLTKSGQNYCQMLANEIQLQEYATQLAKLRSERDATTDKMKTASRVRVSVNTNMSPTPFAGVNDNVQTTKSEYDKLSERLGSINKQIDDINKKAAKLTTSPIKSSSLPAPASVSASASSTSSKGARGAAVGDSQLRYLAQYEEGLRTINSIQAKINALKKEQGDADAAGAQKIQVQIDELESLKKSYTDVGVTGDDALTEPETDWLAEYEGGVRNIAAYEAKIASLREQQQTATQEQYRLLEDEISALEAAEDAFRGVEDAAEEVAEQIRTISDIDAFKGIYGGISGVVDGVGNITEALEDNKTVWEKVSGAISACLQVYDSISRIIEIVDALTVASEASAAAKTAEAVATTVNATATDADAVSSAVATTAAAAEVATTKALVQVYAQLAAARFMAAHASIPFVGFATGSAFATSSTALIQAVGLMPFAKGGIVSGPTLALVGEYGGAANNPEVIAPLDKLRSMMSETGGGGSISLRVRGRDLVGVMANETRIGSRSGRRTNITI